MLGRRATARAHQRAIVAWGASRERVWDVSRFRCAEPFLASSATRRRVDLAFWPIGLGHTAARRHVRLADCYHYAPMKCKRFPLYIRKKKSKRALHMPALYIHRAALRGIATTAPGFLVQCWPQASMIATRRSNRSEWR